MRSKRPVFTEEFKRQAVSLTESSGKKLEEIAKDLRVGCSTLSKWRTKFGTDDSGRKARVASAIPEQDVETRRLKRENERLRKEVEILKKATAFFAKDHL